MEKIKELRPILLVEDSANDVELTLAALAQCNIANEVVVVRDGAQALDYVYCQGEYASRTPGNPAVILLDLKLPKIDGLEVLARLKADPQQQQIPVVMLTSSREERDVVRSYRLGVNSFVVKPVEFAEFFEAIQNLGMFWAILNQPPPMLGEGASKRPGADTP